MKEKQGETDIVPRRGDLLLREYQAETDLEIHLDEESIFSVDIWSFQPQIHPENHLGWWNFRLLRGEHPLRLRFKFSRLDDSSVVVSLGELELKPEASWVNPGFRLNPLQDGHLVILNTKYEIVLLKRILIKCDEKKVLDEFYQRQHSVEGYSPKAPFLHLLHHHKLKILKKYFAKYFKGRILDVGCGLSLFTEIRKEWKFRIIAGDLVLEQMAKRKKERPDISWLVFDASHPPFKASSFDALFAGEIIEHLPDPALALAEWNRILKRDGILLVTTPNRERRVNRINKQAWPISPDHLKEFSYAELNEEILPREGFEPLKKKGIYLELFTRSNKWWKEDYFQREGNKTTNRHFMQLLYRLGFLCPRQSLVLITVAKKVKA